MKKVPALIGIISLSVCISCTALQKHRVVETPKTPEQEVSLETQAKDFYEDGKYPEAIDNLRALLKKDPKNPKYWSQLGSAYAQINQLDYSIQSFQNAIKYDPKNVKAMYNLSIVYGENGKNLLSAASPDGIKECIEKLRKNRALGARLAHNGKLTLLKYFNWDRSAASIERGLKNAVRRKK